MFYCCWKYVRIRYGIYSRDTIYSFDLTKLFGPLTENNLMADCDSTDFHLPLRFRGCFLHGGMCETVPFKPSKYDKFWISPWRTRPVTSFPDLKFPSLIWIFTVSNSVADPDPPDPHVFGPPGSGSTSQRYGSGSGSGSFYQHAKIVRTALIPTILWLFLTFYLWKMM